MSNHDFKIPAWLTSIYLQRVLRNFFKDDSVSVEYYKISPGSSVGNNYIGQILRINIEYIREKQTENVSLIGKAIPETDLAKEFTKNFDVFNVELKMLSETLPSLSRELKGEKFYPYLYQLDADNKMIFREDLKADGYVSVDRKVLLNLEHTLAVIKTLAKMHASSYLLLKKDPNHKDHYLDAFWKKSDAVFPAKLVDGLFTYLIKSLHLYSISEEDKKTFRSFQGKLSDLLEDTYKRKESSFNVILHGDCWQTNMMFNYKNGKVDSVKLLDFQLANYNSIGLDLNFFIFISSMEYVKTKHLEDVFQTYFDTFVNVTGEIDGFTVDTVRNEFTAKLGFGFVMATTFHWMFTADKGFDFDGYMKNENTPSNDEIYQRTEFISEMVNLLPIFKEHKIFKIK